MRVFERCAEPLRFARYDAQGTVRRLGAITPIELHAQAGSAERNELSRRPDLAVVALTSKEVHGTKAERSVCWRNVDAARKIDRQRRIGETLDGDEKLRTAQRMHGAAARQQIRTAHLEAERRRMREWIPGERIADLHEAVDRALDYDGCRSEIAHIEFDTVGIAIGIAVEFDVGRAVAPRRLLYVLEPERAEIVDRAVEDSDAAAPRRPG